jgi:hypothetical protein
MAFVVGVVGIVAIVYCIESKNRPTFEFVMGQTDTSVCLTC